MSSTPATQGSTSPRRTARVALACYVFGLVVVPVAFLAASLRNVHDYGETSDEAYDLMIGRFYVEEYPRTGLARIDDFLDDLQQNYGPFWDVIAVRSGDALLRRGWVKDPTTAYHVPVVVASTLLLGTVFLLGASACGPGCGIAAQLALLLMPQFVGHSQNNQKDQPVALFFAVAMLAFLLARRRWSLRWWLLAGCLAGAAFAVKINAIFALPIAGLWSLPSLLRAPRRLLPWLLRFGVASAAAAGTVLLLWPRYRVHPVSSLLTTIRAFRDHPFNELVFYMGQHTPAREVPWHFPFVMLGVNTPLVHLLLALVALAVLAGLLARRRLDEAEPLLLAALWLFVPIAVQVASRAPRCDGVRHYLYVLPALGLLSGAGAVRLWRWADERSLGPRSVRAVAFALPALLLLQTLVAYHPYQVVFFNRLAGGPSGARERFELDYSGTSLLEASRWIDSRLPAGSRLWFTQPGIHRFRLDEGYSFVGPTSLPNYKISLLRGMVKTYDTDDDYLHPRRKVVYEIAVEGAPILQIFAMPENAGVPEGGSLRPASDVPERLAPGLSAQLSVDNEPHEAVPALERLFIDRRDNPYYNRTTELLASGYLRVRLAGTHLFELSSDDGSTLWLGGRPLVTNVSGRATRRSVVLWPGLYPLRLRYRNEVGGAYLDLLWKPPDALELAPVTAPALLHDAEPPGGGSP